MTKTPMDAAPPLPAPPGSAAEGERSQAARDVLAERRRQVEAEGWTPEHDDEHWGKELAFAASCYCVADEGEAPSAVWPWDWSWWKPRNHRSNLVKAGALILAEIERLDRGDKLASISEPQAEPSADRARMVEAGSIIVDLAYRLEFVCGESEESPSAKAKAFAEPIIAANAQEEKRG